MSHQYRISCLSICLVLFLSSCDMPPPPTENDAKQDLAMVVTEKVKCRRNGYELFLAENGEYCFSHPFGYYQDVASKPNSVMLRSSEDMSAFVDASAGIDGVSMKIPEQVALQVHYEEINGEDKLLDFAKRDLQNQLEPDFIPWFLGEEDAWLVKLVGNGSVSYITYAQHGDYYYKLAFLSPVSLSDTTTCATKLEKLFFTVSGTFTFLK